MVIAFNWIKVPQDSAHTQALALPATVAWSPVLTYHQQLEVMTIYGYYTDRNRCLIN